MLALTKAVVDRLVQGARRRYLAHLFRVDVHVPLERLGSDYGGWLVPSGRLGPNSVCYLAGVGEDISFDVALMEQYGCRVVGIDPTPRAADWVAAHAPEGYHFEAVGLGGTNRVARFYAPANPEHVSHSVANLQRTDTYFEAPLERYATIMARRGDGPADLLKIDIEGAEHEVIADLVAQDPVPPILCVEFDQPASLMDMTRSVRRLRGRGYRLVAIDGFNATFVRQ